MNKVQLIGNLTRDPETRNTQSGINVCNFSIAVNRRFADANGQRGVDYFNIVAWRQLGELCQRYLAKGRKVGVSGSIQTRTYQAQDGSTRTAFDIVADEVEFLTPSAQNAPQQSDMPAAPAFAPAPNAAPQTNYDAPVAPPDQGMTQVDDDELPF